MKTLVWFGCQLTAVFIKPQNPCRPVASVREKCAFPGGEGEVAGKTQFGMTGRHAELQGCADSSRLTCPEPVELVAQSWREAGLADGPLDALRVERVAGAGRRDHMLFDHDRAEVVGAGVQGDLGGLLAHREPRGLYVADVVQHDAADGNQAQVLQRGEVRPDALLFELRTRAAEDPRDEGDEAVVAGGAFVLQRADQQQVLDALGGRFDVAVHHGGRRGQVHAVCLAHHLAPLRNGGFAGRNAAAHLVAEDLGARSGQRVEAGGMEPFERLAVGEPADAGNVGHFGCTERMEPDLRVVGLERAEQLLVVGDVQFRVQAALQQQLVAAEAERFGDLGVVLFDGRDEGLLGLVRTAMEVAELTPRQADVRDVHVAVDLPRHHFGIGTPAAQRVGNVAQFGYGSLFV